MTKIALEALSIATKDAVDKVKEIPRWSNKGPRVDQYLKTAGVPLGQPYCMSAVYTWYHEAAIALSVETPVVKTGYCPTGVDYFHRKGLIRPNSTDAQPGDIIFYWMFDGKQWRYSHTGLIKQNHGNNLVSTVEANTNTDGSREGDGVYIKTRKLNGKHLVANMQEFTSTAKIAESTPSIGIQGIVYPIGLSLDGVVQKHFPAYIYQGETLVGMRSLGEILKGKEIKRILFSKDILSIETQ